ncbi:superoxide dismutase family protein [Lacinutrix neustonica]|uniref:Superoxide dismutase [Cu-Zn] n=1 Tax=Lacinutrix neustonica TaxID=2980107 RepID=A0A9E8MWZ2_9FLAO|nr:superoxide dismutase family protein [Lacinutrix neustonica]WAC03202.1 superoxide dismutase family protein [Lacinutrix neustonica]
MKKLVLLACVSALLFATGCKKNTKDNVEPGTEIETTDSMVETEKTAKVKLTMNAKSESAVKGNIVFTQEGEEVAMVAMLEGLTPGEHAIHLHEKADCSSDDGKSSGGHWNPTNQPHGKWGSAAGYHKGDIGNFIADDKGYAVVNFSTNEWCIGCGDANKDILGKAVIVHQGVDDFTSQPSGDAGSRVSCGGIIE